jgi:hypothetical protein
MFRPAIDDGAASAAQNAGSDATCARLFDPDGTRTRANPGDERLEIVRVGATPAARRSGALDEK